jgi:imidazolonepropionase-like amidohydrolase
MARQKLLIRGGTIIDATGNPPVAGDVLVVDDRIAAIGPPSAVTRDLDLRDPALRIIDATGKTVMPGLIDSHCHINYGEVEAQEELDLYTPVEYRALRAAWNAEKVLRAGVTSICDPGSTGLVTVAVRDAIEAGMFIGPRVTAGGRYLSTPQSITDFYPSWIGVPPTSSGVMTRTRDEMVLEVRRQCKDGFDVVKIAGSGQSLFNVYSSSEVDAFTFDELKVVVDEAHRLGRLVTTHARPGSSASNAARAGVDWIQHASYMGDEDIEVVARSGRSICPAWTLYANLIDWGREFGVPVEIVDQFKRELDIAVKTIRRAHEAGIALMAGTDSGFALTPYGEWHARELELFVDYLGLTPMEAILTATRNNAVALRNGSEVGTLESGRLADILVVDGDPLADIRVLQDRRRLAHIIKGGAMVDTTRPWPERRIWPYEKAMILSRGLTTQSAVRR